MRAAAAFLLAFAIFAAGAATGAMAMRARNQQRGPRELPGIPLRPQQRFEFLKRMDRTLDLSTNQYAQIEGIIRASQDRMQKLIEPIAPQAQREAREVRKQIEAELRPDQKKKFEQMLRDRRAEMQRRNREKQTNNIASPERPQA